MTAGVNVRTIAAPVPAASVRALTYDGPPCAR